MTTSRPSTLPRFDPLTRFFALHPLAVILALAVILRVAVLLAFPSVFAFDQTGEIQGSDSYDTYAQNLLATGVYGHTPGVPDALIPPLYSYALALVYGVFGRGYLQVGAFHILLDALSIAMLYTIARHLFKPPAAVSSEPEPALTPADWIAALAALFYAVYPYLIFQNLTLIDTPLFMMLLHAFVLAMVLLRERTMLDKTTWALAIGGGLALGLGMLARPILPPLALLVAVWFLFRLNILQTLLRLLPVAVIGGLVVVPWIARNYAEFHAFIPMTTTSGANFWQGNSRYTVPYFRAGYDVQWTSPDVMQTQDLTSQAADAERFAQAFQYLRENPAQIPELLWVKFQVYWSVDIAPRYNPTAGQRLSLDDQGSVVVETGGHVNLTHGANDPVNLYSDSLFDQIGRTVHRLYFGALLLLALVGIVVSARGWREVALLWFLQISMTLVYLAFHPSTRYRVPTDPLLFVFSAYALVWTWQWLQRKRRAPARTV